MAKSENNLVKILIVGFRYADYTSKAGKAVKGWFVSYLVPAWKKRDDGVQEMYFEYQTVKIEPENMPSGMALGVWNVEMREDSVYTKYGSAYRLIPSKIVSKVADCGFNLL